MRMQMEGVIGIGRTNLPLTGVQLGAAQDVQ